MALIRLWAICPRLTQRMDLGEAQSLNTGALNALAFIHALWFGEWKGQQVKVVTSFDKVAEVYDDVTEETVEAFVESMRGQKVEWKLPERGNEIVLKPISVTEETK